MRVPKCFICMDKGFVTYKKTVGKTSGEYLAHCICEKGSDYQYDGSSCKRKSDYCVPAISSVADYKVIAKNNFMRWWKIAKNDPEAVEELKKRVQNAKQTARQAAEGVCG